MTVGAMRAFMALMTSLATAVAAQAEPVTYRVDPAHTFVTFEVRHFETSTVRGRFERQEGQVTIDRQARSGHAEITVDTAAVSTGVPALDEWLRGPGLLDSERYPKARFIAERFGFDGDKVNAVTGVLTLRDQSAPVTLRATRFACYLNPLLRREVCGGDFESVVSLGAWGIYADAQAGLPDRIRLLIQIEALRQDAAEGAR